MENRGTILVVGDAELLPEVFSTFQIKVEPQWEHLYLDVEDDTLDVLLYVAKEETKTIENIEQWTTSILGSRIPVIVWDWTETLKLEYIALQKGAAEYLPASCSSKIFYLRVFKQIKRHQEMSALLREIKGRKQDMERLALQTVTAIANLVDSKDRYLKGHSKRVAEYAVAIGEKLQKSEKEKRNLYYMGMLHDIGKIGIPDTVFTKAGRLTDSEYSLIQRHTDAGSRLLKDMTTIPHISQVAGYHHERMDGKGYNHGLRGNEIPLEARIIHIADAYDAMSTDRSYRKRLSPEKIQEELKIGRGKQFDTQLVDIVLELMEEGFHIQEQNHIEPIAVTSLAEEGNALLQRLFLEYTEEIKDISHRDVLTGLWNRGYLEHQVNLFLRTRRHTGAFLI